MLYILCILFCFTLVLDGIISEGACMHYTMQAETFFLYLKNKLRSYSEVQ
jgi:hypothetical protein